MVETYAHATDNRRLAELDAAFARAPHPLLDEDGTASENRCDPDRDAQGVDSHS
jgi:hypothetical protein